SRSCRRSRGALWRWCCRNRARTWRGSRCGAGPSCSAGLGAELLGGRSLLLGPLLLEALLRLLLRELLRLGSTLHDQLLVVAWFEGAYRADKSASRGSGRVGNRAPPGNRAKAGTALVMLFTRGVRHRGWRMRRVKGKSCRN